MTMDTQTKQRARQTFATWQGEAGMPADLQQDIARMNADEAMLLDAFYRDLEFGTGGLRGVLGAGTNRMNIYTVRRATRGLAQTVLARCASGDVPSVVIGYDCRRMSPEFALEAALVLAAAGVRAYLFGHLVPTPQLSFAVRSLRATAGIMITASHNPPEYNGYKVYAADGGQILPDIAEEVLAHMAEWPDLFSVPVLTEAQASATGQLVYLDHTLDTAYVDRVVQAIRVPSLSDHTRAQLTVVYSPLHGTGNHPVRAVLAQAGYTAVHVVQAQAEPDGEFSTVKSPNPEEASAFTLALEAAREVAADIVIATDPDADRVGLAVRDADGQYTLLSGNQTGGLLLEFLLHHQRATAQLPVAGRVLKTIVTSELGAAVAAHYGLTVENTLTGFKYIGERIAAYEEAGDVTFVFGYEESYGYLIAPFVRDKDAVQSCLLIAEMAAWAKSRGQTLLAMLADLYAREGYFAEHLISKTMPGVEGMARMQAVMGQLRSTGIVVEGMALAVMDDYQSGERRWSDGGRVERLTLPVSNVLKYTFTNRCWLAVRPSGTEPKIKFYLGAQATTQADCQSYLSALMRAIEHLLDTN